MLGGITHSHPLPSTPIPRKRPEASAEALIAVPGHGPGWFRSGDIARVDDEGFMYDEARYRIMCHMPHAIAIRLRQTVPLPCRGALKGSNGLLVLRHRKWRSAPTDTFK